MRRRKTRPLGSVWRLFSIVSKCIKVKDLDISGRDQEVFLTNFAIEAARLIGWIDATWNARATLGFVKKRIEATTEQWLKINRSVCWTIGCGSLILMCLDVCGQLPSFRGMQLRCAVGSFDFPLVRSDDMSNFMINWEPAKLLYRAYSPRSHRRKTRLSTAQTFTVCWFYRNSWNSVKCGPAGGLGDSLLERFRRICRRHLHIHMFTPASASCS